MTIKLPFRELHGLPDAQSNFEQLEQHVVDSVQNLTDLADLHAALGSLLGTGVAVRTIGAYVDGRSATFGFAGAHWGCGIARNGLGSYTITPSTAFGVLPLVLAWAYGNVTPSVVNSSGTVSVGQVDLKVYNSVTGAAQDDLFAVLAIG